MIFSYAFGCHNADTILESDPVWSLGIVAHQYPTTKRQASHVQHVSRRSIKAGQDPNLWVRIVGGLSELA